MVTIPEGAELSGNEVFDPIVMRQLYEIGYQKALAIRVSNVVSFVVLFIAGYQWGKHTGANPWRTGLLLFAVGAIMVLIAIPLGG